MLNTNRGWILTSEDGTIQKNCANCERYTQCEQKPRWNQRVCKDFDKLEVE